VTNGNVIDPVEAQKYYMIDSYAEFVKTEGVPVVEGFVVDSITMPLEPWPRLGGKGAYVHLTGRGELLSCYVAEIAPGGQLNPEQHFHDELIHVVAGRGATTIDLPGGGKHTFEWGPGSAFSIPLNARHQHFNGSGSEPARFAAVTNLPIILNLFHSTDLVYKNPMSFPERFGDERYFRGEGEFRAVRPGRHQWETNFVPNLIDFELPTWKERGAGGKNIMFTLADSPLHVHLSEFPVGTYKKAHRHDAGFHIFMVSGEGYSLLWLDGEDPVATQRVDWKLGTLFAPPDGPTFHQHFNLSKEPARYLVFAFQGARYALLEGSKRVEEPIGADTSVKEGGNQIEYQDEDPRVLDLFEAELAKRGIQANMRQYVGARSG
jgi:quercetin dioxygenase-like cupin family protein